MITVDTYKQLKALPIHAEGEIAYVVKEDQKYQYSEESGWQVYKAEENILSMKLYDMNKQIIAQMPNMTKEDIISIINEYHAAMKNSFYMLMFKEISYFTMFYVNQVDESYETLAQEVINCGNDWGTIKSAHIVEDGSAIEVWIELPNKEITVGYFFSYNEGVIECR